MGALPGGTVTFLMGDVEGSTRLAARLGSSYPQVLRKGLKIACDVAQDLGGHFVNAQGDSFLIVFESASAAVGAAIEAQKALADGDWPDDGRVKIRMGLHSGEAAGSDGDPAGLDVNRTARVANAGHGGQILVSSVTQRLVNGRLPADVEFDEVGAFRLDGIDEPEQLWQVNAEGLERSFPPLRATAIGDDAVGALVGRTQQVAQIGAALDEVMAGRGRLLLLTGDAGMGKTRLCDEISAKVRSRGITVLWGRCWEGSDAPAFWPWTQVLQPLLDRGPSLSKAHQTQLDKLMSAKAAASADRFKLFDSVVQLLRASAKGSPLVFVFDDAHAADDSSLQLLQFVARDLRSMKVLVLATCRESEIGADPVLSAAFGAIEREGEKISLPPLTEAEVASLIEASTGASGSELASIVLEASEGNPLFVREVVALFGREGDLHRPDESTGFLVPAGARDVLKKRLSALPEATLSLLTLASAIGRNFSLGSLQLVTELDLDGVLKALEEAEHQGIVRQTSALGSYSFGHVLLRETLYESLSSSERMRLHARIAAALEQDAEADPHARIAELAHHYFKAAQAGDLDKTLEHNRTAGKLAEERAAFRDATRHYKRALLAANLVRVDDAVRSDLKSAIARAEKAADAPIGPGAK